MKKANFAPLYDALGIYPAMAEICRDHGYALAVHGSMANDFDLIAIPWTNKAVEPQVVVDAMYENFAFKREGAFDTVEHGRMRYMIHLSFGECRIDLSFMPRITNKEG